MNIPFFKVTCENGCSWVTAISINTTDENITDLERAKNFFIGKLFNTALYPGECMSKAVHVEQLHYYFD